MFGKKRFPHLRLHHSWSLRPQHFHRLKDVYYALVSHSLQDNAEGDENSCPTNTGAVQEKAQSSPRCTAIMLHISGHSSCESEYCWLILPSRGHSPRPSLLSAVGCLPTVDRDRSILAELLFCFMDLADEVDESFP